MTQPLAIVVYEKLLPGTQLVNRLQDLSYRVRVVTDPDSLATSAQQEKPMLVVADVTSTRHDVCAAIRQLRENPNTRHIPVIAFGPDEAAAWQSSAQAAGAVLVTGETALLSHLPEFLEQALQVD